MLLTANWSIVHILQNLNFNVIYFSEYWEYYRVVTDRTFCKLSSCLASFSSKNKTRTFVFINLDFGINFINKDIISNTSENVFLSVFLE